MPDYEIAENTIQVEGAQVIKLPLFCHARSPVVIYEADLPLVSYGKTKNPRPATTNKLAEIQTSTSVSTPTYAAIIGAMRPDSRLPRATNPFAVPRTGTGNSSGV
jgi:hypothetical protein